MVRQTLTSQVSERGFLHCEACARIPARENPRARARGGAGELAMQGELRWFDLRMVDALPVFPPFFLSIPFSVALLIVYVPSSSSHFCFCCFFS